LSLVTLLSLYCFGVEAFTTTRGFTGGEVDNAGMIMLPPHPVGTLNGQPERAGTLLVVQLDSRDSECRLLSRLSAMLVGGTRVQKAGNKREEQEGKGKGKPLERGKGKPLPLPRRGGSLEA
jgi:hypothetical protein